MIGKGIVLNRAELVCLLDQMEADRLLGGEPVPETVHYEAAVPQEDADEISWMADQWEQYQR